MVRGRTAAAVVAVSAAIVGVSGGIAARTLARPSHGPTPPHAAIVDVHPGRCPKGTTRVGIGQWSAPGQLPVRVVACSAAIPTNYAPDTSVAP